MMREGWEYKKLGDICNVINGLWTGKKEPFINVAVIRNTNFSKDCQLNLENVAYIDVEAKQFASRKLLCGDIIIEKSGGSEKQPVGRPILFNISEGDYSFSNFTSTLRIKEDAKVESSFLHKCLYASYLKGETLKLQSKTTGLHNLNMKGYLRLNIPLPPKSTQLAIVSELDKINELIRLKKEQLKDFDNLAQSLFYEMFGDPVENEKGWEVKKLGEVYKMKSGDSLSTKSFEEGDIPVYGGNGISGYHNKYNKDGSYIIIGRVGVYCGNVRIVKGRFWLTDNAFELLYDNSSQNEVFVCSLLTHLNLRKYANAAAQPVISNNTLKHVSIPLPPLPLQHFFAHRIEQIEHQKAEVQKSITDLETLLASRMQYWFE